MARAHIFPVGVCAWGTCTDPSGGDHAVLWAVRSEAGKDHYSPIAYHLQGERFRQEGEKATKGAPT